MSDIKCINFKKSILCLDTFKKVYQLFRYEDSDSA